MIAGIDSRAKQHGAFCVRKGVWVMKHRQRCYHTQSGVNYLTKVEVLYGSGAEMYYREGDPYKELTSGQARAINAYQNFRRFYNQSKVKLDAKG